MGMFIWEGPSAWDGTPIVLLATGFPGARSQNEKTGRMIQTYIMRQDKSPSDSKRDDSDDAVCGDCPHRLLRTCYVNTWRGPDGVWSQWKRGKSAPFDLSAFSMQLLRMGTWGDPAMVPLDVWLTLLAVTRGRTAYTHQWRDHPEYMPYAMASCDTPAEAAEAESLGWRVFAAWQGERPEGFTPCPASAEQGRRLQCESCLRCDGAATAQSQPRSVFIEVHGSRKKAFQPERLGKGVPASAGTP